MNKKVDFLIVLVFETFLDLNKFLDLNLTKF